MTKGALLERPFVLNTPALGFGMLILKIIHLLAVATGVGFGVAGLLIAGWVAGKPPAQMPMVPMIRMRLGQLGFISLLVLWITGLWMYFAHYETVTMPIAFHLKLGAATLLLLISATLQVVMLRAKRAGTPPPPFAAGAAKVATASALLALILAVIAFTP